MRRILFHDLALCSFLCATVAGIQSTKLKVLQKERGDERRQRQRMKKDGRGYGWNEEGCGLLLNLHKTEPISATPNFSPVLVVLGVTRLSTRKSMLGTVVPGSVAMALVTASPRSVILR